MRGALVASAGLNNATAEPHALCTQNLHPLELPLRLPDCVLRRNLGSDPLPLRALSAHQIMATFR